MSKPRIPARLKAVGKACKAAGWTYKPTAKGHPCWHPPRGLRHVVDEQGSPVRGEVTFEGTGPLVAPVSFALTPSDIAGDRNGRKELERAGVAL